MNNPWILRAEKIQKYWGGCATWTVSTKMAQHFKTKFQARDAQRYLYNATAVKTVIVFDNLKQDSSSPPDVNVSSTSVDIGGTLPLSRRKNMKHMGLKPCPCGKTPTYLSIIGDRVKWAYAAGDCCAEWEIGFQSEYHNNGSEELNDLAIHAWNSATRKECPTCWGKQKFNER